MRMRSSRHLAWVRTNGCLVCGRHSHAHHLMFAEPSAMSKKSGDDWAVPLCPEHHRELHAYGDEKTNFGIFLDSSPDRWGRVLLRRREAALARLEKRASNNLTELDFLLGVFDGNRMGGLRFKRTLDGPFLDDNKQYAVPAWTSLRELAQISLRLEQEEAINDPSYLHWLNLLVAPGSSLGGARPKG